jgi:hypothetical protein
MMKNELIEIQKVMEILIKLRCRNLNDAADLIVEQYKEIQSLRKIK